MCGLCGPEQLQARPGFAWRELESRTGVELGGLEPEQSCRKTQQQALESDDCTRDLPFGLPIRDKGAGTSRAQYHWYRFRPHCAPGFSQKHIFAFALLSRGIFDCDAAVFSLFFLLNLTATRPRLSTLVDIRFPNILFPGWIDFCYCYYVSSRHSLSL